MLSSIAEGDDVLEAAFVFGHRPGATGHGEGEGHLISLVRGGSDASLDYLRELREYKALHGTLPVESPGSHGCLLAQRTRKAWIRRYLAEVELAEMDA